MSVTWLHALTDGFADAAAGVAKNAASCDLPSVSSRHGFDITVGSPLSTTGGAE